MTDAASAPPPAQGSPVPGIDPGRMRAEVERLAADTARMRARLGPGDAPDLREAILAAMAHGRG